jgi:ATP-binding cassette subfamily C protein CydC
MGNAERLVAAVQARASAQQAGERLASAGCDESPSRLPIVQATHGGHGLTVSGYRLPTTPTRRGRQLELAVAAGHTLIVTGASGAGKTTLLNAIAAALGQPPASGAVTAVLADDYLFTGTVAGNIRLADPAATDDDIADLLTCLHLDRSGLVPDTEVGVGGRNLSGGEQRRLSIVRALATSPDVLIVDEPTTGLDAGTGDHVLTALRRRLPEAVLVLAMHSLPAVPGVLGHGWSTVSLD